MAGSSASAAKPLHSGEKKEPQQLRHRRPAKKASKRDHAAKHKSTAATAKTHQGNVTTIAWVVLALAVALVIFGISTMHLLPTIDSEDGSDTTQDQQLQEEQEQEPPEDPQRRITETNGIFEVLEEVGHDTDAFTQGLTFRPSDSSIVYESTGMYGKSSVQKINLTNGNILGRMSLGKSYFGEGLTYFDDADGNPRLVWLTWKEQTGFVLHADKLVIVQQFTFNTTTNEGWGITYNPRAKEFIVSDGSGYLVFWDLNFQEVGRVECTFLTREMAETSQTPRPLDNINELEWDDESQTVLANLWYQDVIIRIDPESGRVVKTHDFRYLYHKSQRDPDADCFNGIALSADGDLWVTGKNWPLLYRVELLDEEYEEHEYTQHEYDE